MVSNYSIFRPIVLLTLDLIALICDENCDETCWIGLLLKNIGGCTTVLTLQVKIISCACLDGSVLKLIFYRKAHSLFCVNPQSSLAVAVGSWIMVNKEMSSAKSFGFDWSFSKRLFI